MMQAADPFDEEGIRHLLERGLPVHDPQGERRLELVLRRCREHGYAHDTIREKLLASIVA